MALITDKVHVYLLCMCTAVACRNQVKRLIDIIIQAYAKSPLLFR